jgi:hypothetical protein
MTTNAARQAVFGTSELLEQIILYLPMKTIFGIQCVCQKFRNVIATSPEIQTKMFLRLRKDVPEEAWVLESTTGNRHIRGNDARFRKVDPHSTSGLKTPVVLNPLLQLTILDPQVRSAKDRFCHSERPGERVEMEFSQAHFGSEPSFLVTYITDPPCYVAEAEIAAQYLFDPKGDPKEDSVRGTVSGYMMKLKKGMKIGDVVLARDIIHMGWDASQSGLGDFSLEDAQLEEVIHETASVLMQAGLNPTLTLQLWDVVIPTDEEWTAVSSGHEDVAS